MQEIKTTANPQHPHILPLFDSVDVDLYYVVPLVAANRCATNSTRSAAQPVRLMNRSLSPHSILSPAQCRPGSDFARGTVPPPSMLWPGSIALQRSGPL